MVQDLSFIHEKPTEEEEEAVRKAVEQECIRAISTYLSEVADAMETNGIETLNAPSIRAMAETLNQRLEAHDEPAN